MRSHPRESSETAVSPVIAVILLVAVTVALSAVIGGFALNLGQQTTDGGQQNIGVSTSNGIHENGSEYVTLRVVSAPSGANITYRVNGTSGTLGGVGDSVTLTEGVDYSEGDTIAVLSEDEGSVAQTVDTTYSSSSDSTTETVNVAIDTFERGDISPYSGNTGYFSTTTSPVHNGTYALRGESNNEGIHSMPGDGLNYYPERGDTFRFYLRIGDADSGGQFIFGRNSSNHRYILRFSNHNDQLRLRYYNGTGYEGLDNASVSWKTDTWYKVVIEWHNPTITVDLAHDNGTHVTTISADDTRQDKGGIGFQTYATYGQTTAQIWWDDVNKTAG